MQTTPEAMILAGYSPPYPGQRAGHRRRRGGGAVPRARHHRFARHVSDPQRSIRLAEITGGDYVIIEGGGHLLEARDPVKVNLLLRDFVRRVAV